MATKMATKQPRRYETVQLDPIIVQAIRVRAAELKSNIKALIEEAVAIAGKTDPRFRFDEQRGKR